MGEGCLATVGLVQVWTGESEDLVVGSVGLVWGGVREPVGEMQTGLGIVPC